MCCEAEGFNAVEVSPERGPPEEYRPAVARQFDTLQVGTTRRRIQVRYVRGSVRESADSDDTHERALQQLQLRDLRVWVHDVAAAEEAFRSARNRELPLR